MGSTIPRRRLYSNRPLRLSIRVFIGAVCGCRSLALLPSKKGVARTSSSTRGYRVFLCWAEEAGLAHGLWILRKQPLRLGPYHAWFLLLPTQDR
jgi:hypothetical protein